MVAVSIYINLLAFVSSPNLAANILTRGGRLRLMHVIRVNGNLPRGRKH